MSRPLLLAVLLLAGCAATTCETVAVTPGKQAVVYCHRGPDCGWFDIIPWERIVGPWPTEEGIQRGPYQCGTEAGHCARHR